LTPKVPSPNGLSGFFKVGGFLLDFTPFLVDAGALVYIGPEEGTRSYLRGRLGTRVCLGWIVPRVAGASLVWVPL